MRKLASVSFQDVNLCRNRSRSGANKGTRGSNNQWLILEVDPEVRRGQVRPHSQKLLVPVLLRYRRSPLSGANPASGQIVNFSDATAFRMDEGPDSRAQTQHPQKGRNTKPNDVGADTTSGVPGPSSPVAAKELSTDLGAPCRLCTDVLLCPRNRSTPKRAGPSQDQRSLTFSISAFA